MNSLVAEIIRLSAQKRVTLLIDGLEKIPPGPESLDLFEALASIRNDIELVVVIPWHASFGPQAETVIRAGERFVAVRALDVQGDAGEPGREVLRKILIQRLRWPENELALGADLEPAGSGHNEELTPRLAFTQALVRNDLVDEAIRWSGGLPRVFLQLLADAGAYAKLRRIAVLPTIEDLNDACADQIDSFRRLLLPGDIDAIRAADGTSGSELALDRKIRLMAHGVLLERVRGTARILDVHPLARATFDPAGAHA